MAHDKRIIYFENFEKMKIDSPYRLVLLASQRAKEIIRNTKTQGKILEMKPTEVALRTLLGEKVEILTRKPEIPISEEALDTSGEEENLDDGEEVEEDQED